MNIGICMHVGMYIYAKMYPRLVQAPPLYINVVRHLAVLGKDTAEQLPHVSGKFPDGFATEIDGRLLVKLLQSLVYIHI